MLLVERENQMTRLRELLADCLAGRGSVTAVSGPVASGKTELLHFFGEFAGSAGAAVLTATARCSERDIALGVAGQIFRNRHFSSADRERALRLPGDGSGIAPCDADLLSHCPLPAQVSQIQWQLLHGLSERTPVVVLVDDLQFADAASLEFLIQMGQRLRTSRIQLVAAECDTATGVSTTELSWRTGLLRERHFSRLRVRPLSPRATGEMLTELIGADPGDRASTDAWHRLSGGNPLLLRALAEDHREHGAVGALPTGPIAGEEFGRAVDACVRRAGRRFRDAARALAVLDASDSHARLARLLGRPRPQVDETLEAMDAFGVLDAGRFRHPAARAAVLAGMSATERAALHRDAARLLYEAGDPAPAVAVHLVAGRHSEEPWVFPVVLEAAREALRRDDTAFAEACLDVAAEACADEDQRVTVTMLRSLVDFRTDPDTACRRLRPLITALREGRLTGCQSVSLLGRLLWNGTSDEIGLALTRLERASDTLDPASAAEYRAAREWLHASHPALLPRAAARTRGRRSVVRAADGTPGQMAGVLNRLLRSGPDPESVRGAELALQTTVLDDDGFDTVHQALAVLVYADRCDLAVGWCDTLLRESARRDVPAWQALFAAVRAEIAFRQGDVRLAEQYARRAMSLMSLRSWGVLIGSPLSGLLLSAAATGTITDIGAPPVSALPEQLFQTRFGAQYLQARGRWRLSVNLLHGALDDLTRCGRLLREWGVDLPSFVPWRGDAVATLLRLGRTDEARELAVEQLAMVPGTQRRTRGMALRTAASVSDPRRRAPLLREAVDLLETSGDRLELAHALADLSEAHTRAGQGDRARMVARQAHDIAEENGLVPLVRRLAARDSRAPGPDRGAGDRVGVGVLSSSEAQVAALAAAGLSNREIAEKLFITVSTVEQHLTHTYRKLRVKGRADLPLSLLDPDGREGSGLPEHRLRQEAARAV
ncbi:LuxR C-terminal-related transcriptional regulator [Streptomyces sp. MBT62]|uniref:helix-turn-helix transcriptional regulator n=1 Tax=Streptomyces sp. MBT62 TaxID=2800410 RepID=UPI0027DAB855|nr:LuxR C-terminal-related transcriptional regulator [Streptomyces sp. MBT62]